MFMFSFHAFDWIFNRVYNLRKLTFLHQMVKLKNSRFKVVFLSCSMCINVQVNLTRCYEIDIAVDQCSISQLINLICVRPKP